ncbi:hypothetical protein EJ04DRAFT_138480 [Polyplosphaeria fusca]|uniref:Uncharacterized protein n=1 Tax=Polyplosphaeria fusca TaxID=682080 RepID=A0A9P4R4Q3_9PLEO|nr:hypothetical protein EJ04DRAFT_138480 [Polyplosphaeria fusca]
MQQLASTSSSINSPAQAQVHTPYSQVPSLLPYESHTAIQQISSRLVNHTLRAQHPQHLLSAQTRIPPSRANTHRTFSKHQPSTDRERHDSARDDMPATALASPRLALPTSTITSSHHYISPSHAPIKSPLPNSSMPHPSAHHLQPRAYQKAHTCMPKKKKQNIARPHHRTCTVRTYIKVRACAREQAKQKPKTNANMHQACTRSLTRAPRARRCLQGCARCAAMRARKKQQWRMAGRAGDGCAGWVVMMRGEGCGGMSGCESGRYGREMCWWWCVVRTGASS